MIFIIAIYRKQIRVNVDAGWADSNVRRDKKFIDRTYETKMNTRLLPHKQKATSLTI